MIRGQATGVASHVFGGDLRLFVFEASQGVPQPPPGIFPLGAYCGGGESGDVSGVWKFLLFPREAMLFDVLVSV